MQSRRRGLGCAAPCLGAQLSWRWQVSQAQPSPTTTVATTIGMAIRFTITGIMVTMVEGIIHHRPLCMARPIMNRRRWFMGLGLDLIFIFLEGKEAVLF